LPVLAVPFDKRPEPVFTVKPRVRGFIYGVAGNAGMGVWAQKPLFTNQIQWIFSISIIFGHRQSFLKNCSPLAGSFLGTAAFFARKVPIIFGAQGEHFVKTRCLCPISLLSH
jgi:hypothetical protein